MKSVLKVVDNLGAIKVMCIQALKGKGARLGDTIVANKIFVSKHCWKI